MNSSLLSGLVAILLWTSPHYMDVPPTRYSSMTEEPTKPCVPQPIKVTQKWQADYTSVITAEPTCALGSLEIAVITDSFGHLPGEYGGKQYLPRLLAKEFARTGVSVTMKAVTIPSATIFDLQPAVEHVSNDEGIQAVIFLAGSNTIKKPMQIETLEEDLSTQAYRLYHAGIDIVLVVPPRGSLHLQTSYDPQLVDTSLVPKFNKIAQEVGGVVIDPNLSREVTPELFDGYLHLNPEGLRILSERIFREISVRFTQYTVPIEESVYSSSEDNPIIRGYPIPQHAGGLFRYPYPI